MILELFAICVKSFKPHKLFVPSVKIDAMTELRKILSANMKAYRTELGYSQARLAELVNTAPNYIAQIENGKRFPTDTMLEKIASSLQKNAYELFALAHYEKKLEKDWQTQVLIDLEQFIHTRIAKAKKEKA